MDKTGKVSYICEYKNQKLYKDTFFDEEGEIEYIQVYEYDANGNRSKVTTLNAKGEIISIIEYKPDGSFKSMNYENGKLSMEYNYTSDYKLINAKGYDENGEFAYYNEYTYDENGNMISSKSYGENGNLAYEYIYDGNGKTISSKSYSEDGSCRERIYDENGNVTNTKIYDKDGNLVQEYVSSSNGAEYSNAGDSVKVN